MDKPIQHRIANGLIKSGFVIYCTVICLLFIYINSIGWNALEIFQSSKWNPKGKPTPKGTIFFYHK